MTSPHDNRTDLGDEVRRKRKAANMTQADLAKLAAIATTNVGKVERGELVSATTLRAVARALQLPAELVAPLLADTSAGDPAEPQPQDYPDEMEYMNAVYWYLRKIGMSHEAVMRGFNMAAAVYVRRSTERDSGSARGDELGHSS